MRVLILLCGLFLAACSGPKAEAPRAGPWALNAGESLVRFVSIKKGTIAESHSFTEISGSVDNDGAAQISVKLDSVETYITVRNERMRQYLFETQTHPIATINAELNLASYSAYKIGERGGDEISVQVNMHGTDQSYEAEVLITRVSENMVLVESRSPVFVDAADFELVAGVAKLQELAKLPSITTVVPVSFSLVFER